MATLKLNIELIVDSNQINSIKIVDLHTDTNSVIIQLEDESDVFEIVDQYLIAILDNERALYWANWKL